VFVSPSTDGALGESTEIRKRFVVNGEEGYLQTATRLALHFLNCQKRDHFVIPLLGKKKVEKHAHGFCRVPSEIAMMNCRLR
jgi:hypothetical protein